MKNCLGCGGVMDPVLKTAFHPSCMLHVEEVSADCRARADEMAGEFIKIIKWADANSERSLQIEPGPSELGDPCDRRIGYRLAATPEVNRFTDPWAAIVGTAIHAWLEKAMIRWCEMQGGEPAWKTERTVEVDTFIRGHSDLYWVPRKTVIDWKSKNAEKMRLAREVGAPAFPGEIVQAHLYGMGYEKNGFPVTHVALACLPRSGRIKDMQVLVEPYDPRIAQYALNRMYEIGELLLSLEIFAHPQRWSQVPATPTDSCGLCPWYQPNRLTTADETGCPGL